MKRPRHLWRIPACLAAGLMLLGSTSAVKAAAPPLNGSLELRPLSAVDIANKSYALPSNSELSGGINTVGVGTAVYLDAEVNIAVPPTDITNVTWSYVFKSLPFPPGTPPTVLTNSGAVLTNSPLGTNVPIYEPSTRLVSQVAARRLLRPGPLAGQYTVTVKIQSASSGTTNVTQTITASTYIGAQSCAVCHGGGTIAENKFDSWSQTLHAHIFSDEVDGLLGSTMKTSCLQCHTTGYSANTNVMDGGFSSAALLYGWTIPSPLTNGNWASMQTNYPYVAAMANVQCESCHGPGYNHASQFGNTNSPTWPSITVSYASGDCNQCHDDATHHPFGTEWLNSGHAVSPRQTGSTCVRCHTAQGFENFVDGAPAVSTDYNPINCQTCHEPHGETTPTNNPHMIRTLASVTFQEGTVVTNAGEGLVCMQCHQARVNASTYASDPNNAGSRFGPHHGPQGDMLEGINGYEYGQPIPSSAHATAVTNTCVTCHMQNIPSSNPAFTIAGGHTFNVSSTNGDLVAACQQCHGSSVTSFDIALKDYNGDGVIEGVQTEVKHLMDKLSTLLPNSSGVIDGAVKVPVTAKTWTAPQMEAAYNWQFVTEDRSMGIHNTAYTVGLLKASIANLTGDANNDGMPDAWQVQYYGNINNPAAAPNAINPNSGVPNWMMYALGLDPNAAFTVDGSGTVFFNGNNIVNGATNTIAIYTAAEIAFDTHVGTSYQIQGISALSGTWSNISTNIPGTGGTISYVTPTRNDAQMFFRVVHTP